MRTMTMLLLMLAFAATALAAEVKYVIEPAESAIIFESKAPLESFEGKTSAVSGHFTINPEALPGPVDLEIQVQLASFDTGVGKRNRHMRENHFETGKFPVATFVAEAVTRAEPSSLDTGRTTRLTLRGTLDLHGVRRPMSCDIQIETTRAGTLRIQGEFPVSLKEHAIKRPKFLVMKLADEQKVRFVLTARSASGGTP